jgi:phosphoribosylaminoimidazole carboxylase (NCAIR synthetase)
MADTPAILIVGGSHAEIPLIDAAHALGLHVTTTGNQPQGLGHARADEYVPADFSDREAIRSLAERLGVVGIVSGCNDFAALSTAWAAEQIGLGGHDPFDMAIRIHHKDRFRELLEELGIPTPASGVVRGLDEAIEVCRRIGFPVIVKPVDLTGGKGMTVCRSADELDAAVAHGFSLTRQSHLVVEQFMEGTRHGFTCFVTGGRVGFWFADDEQYFHNQFLVSGTTTPTSMPTTAITELVDAVETITRSLELVDGLMHVQCIQTAVGPRIVELCRRCPGDLYPWFVQLSTGYDYAGAVLRSELALQRDPDGATATPQCITRHCLMGECEGTLRRVELDDDLRARTVEQMLWWTEGQPITNHLVDKFGIVFFGFDDEATMRAVTKELPARIAVEIDPAESEAPASTQVTGA